MRDGNRIKRSILSKRGARMQMKLTLIPLSKFQEQELIDYGTVKVGSTMLIRAVHTSMPCCDDDDEGLDDDGSR